MNFELKTFDLSSAAIEKCDALIVLLGQSFKPADDVLSTLVAQALKAKDLETKAGKTLVLYRASGLACTRAVLAGIGDGSAKDVRQAVSAAVSAVKSSNVKKVLICFAALPDAQALRAALVGDCRGQLCLHHHQIKTRGASDSAGGAGCARCFHVQARF
jgi:leucyl aminopeptidase